MAKPNEGTIDEQLILRMLVTAFVSGTMAMKLGSALDKSSDEVAQVLEEGFKEVARDLADMLRRGLTADEGVDELRTKSQAYLAKNPRLAEAAKALRTGKYAEPRATSGDRLADALVDATVAGGGIDPSTGKPWRN